MRRMSTATSPPPSVLVAWSRARGRMAVQSVAHLVEPSGVGRALCGVTVPGVVWRWVARAERPGSTAVAQVWVEDDTEIESATRCVRCASSKRAGQVVSVTQWHTSEGLTR